jgi:hypothetical protein
VQTKQILTRHSVASLSSPSTNPLHQLNALNAKKYQKPIRKYAKSNGQISLLEPDSELTEIDKFIRKQRAQKLFEELESAQK